MKRSIGLRGNLRQLTAFALATAAVAAVRPTVSYRALELGAGAGQIGLIGGAFAALSLVAAIPIGSLIDRRGQRSFFLAGAGLIALAAVASASVSVVILLPLTQALLGLGHLCSGLSTQTLTALGPDASRDHRFARLAVAASVGQLGGPLLAGWILDQPAGPGELAPTVTVFYAAAALALTAAALAWSGRPWRRDRPTPAPITRTPTGILGMVRIEGIKTALVTSIAVVTAVDILIAYLPVLGEEIGLTPGFVGVLLSVRAGATIACRLVAGRLIDRFGRRLTLAGNVLVAGVAMAGIAWIGAEAALLVLTAALGFGLGLGQPITAAWVSGRAPPGRVSAALALRLSGNRLGQLVLPAAFGALAGVIGTPFVFMASAAGLVGSALWVGGGNSLEG